MCIILFQFLKQQVEFVNENNISDMEQASMTNQDPGQRFRRIRQANQDVSRPSIVEPSLKEQVCSHFKILIFLYVCTLDVIFSSIFQFCITKPPKKLYFNLLYTKHF